MRNTLVLIALATLLVASRTALAQSAAPDIDPIVIVSQPPPPPPRQLYYPPLPPGYTYAPPGMYRPQQPLPPRPPPRPRPPMHPPRYEFDTVVGGVALFGSGYNSASMLWGFGGFKALSQFALDLGVHAGRYVMVGARVGYGQSSAGVAPLDGAELTLQEADLDVLLRVGYPITRSRLVLVPAVQLELGALDAWATLRNESQSSWMPRFAAMGMITLRGQWFGVDLRVGYQRAVWPSAGGGGVDLALEGIVIALGIEVTL